MRQSMSAAATGELVALLAGVSRWVVESGWDGCIGVGGIGNECNSTLLHTSFLSL